MQWLPVDHPYLCIDDLTNIVALERMHVLILLLLAALEHMQAW
jgi:hypothetical protein